jgi:hypothetical protein
MANEEKMQNELDKRIKGYWHLINNDSGNQKDILDIDPDFIDEFGSAGFITFGIDASATPRFMTTELGKEYAKEAYMALCSELAQKDFEELFE